MALLDDLTALLGGGQYGDPSAPATNNALTQLRDALSGYGANSMRGFQTMREQLPQAASDVGTGLAGLAERLRLVATGRPVGEATVPVAQAIAPAAGAVDFASGGLLNPLSAGLRGAGSALRGAGHAFADDTGAITLGGGRGRPPGIGHNQPPAEPMFPQYAEAYPPTAEAVLKTDKNTGKAFLSKTKPPETLAFEAERKRIKADMEANGYEPYYKPEDRYYVDPSTYPPANVRTRTDPESVPRTFDTIANYMTTIGAPETMNALRAGYDKGLKLGNAEHWYAMGQLERSYIDELGEVAGKQKFLDEFVVPMGATTSGNDPAANFLMAHFLEYQRKRGDPQTAHGYDLPYPVGGRRGGHTEIPPGGKPKDIGGNMRDYQAMRERGGYPGVGAGTPKMHDFDRSFLGDLTQPTMDEQMAHGMLDWAGPDVANKARTGAYGLLEGPVHTLAGELGILPGNVQDVAWAGFKNEPGKPMISFINDSIERTHRLTGMPRDEIVRRGLVRKEIPMYGVAGALGLGALSGGYGRDDRRY